MSLAINAGETGKAINEILNLKNENMLVKVEVLLNEPNKICFCSAPIRNAAQAKKLRDDLKSQLFKIQHLFANGYQLTAAEKPTRLIAVPSEKTTKNSGVFVQRCTNATVVQIMAIFKEPISTPPISVRSGTQHHNGKVKKSAQAPLPRSMIS